jgi:hypothetical protein
MNWFKNLNATPRLMSSFGVLLVLTLGISYLAISNLGGANDRVDFLYHKDMVGSTHADGITIDVTTIRGDDLNPILSLLQPPRRMSLPRWLNCMPTSMKRTSFS